MINSYSIWLLQASFGIGMLAVVYELLLRKLTFFNLNRIFLIAGLIFCLIIPLLPLPGMASIFTDKTEPYFNLIINPYQPENTNANLSAGFNSDYSPETDILSIVRIVLMAVYIAGVVRKIVMLISGLKSVFDLRQKSLLIAQEGKIHIFRQNTLPTFSFGNNIFLHGNIDQLSAHEQEYVLQHEQTHIKQKHTADILLYELAGIVFWFHPAMKYLSGVLKELHEYLVDSHMASIAKPLSRYGLLLVKLATQKSQGIRIINSFSNTSTLNRIEMLTKPKSRSMHRLKFLSAFPIMSCLIVLSSFIDATNKPFSFSKQEISKPNILNETNLTITEIIWAGNNRYTSVELNNILGIKVGDLYNATLLDERLLGVADKTITSLYMNDGHLFFKADKQITTKDDKVILRIEIFEGPRAKIGQLTVTGNKSVSDENVLKLIDIKPGEYFNRQKLILSQQKLANMGKFDSENVGINPKPNLVSFKDDREGIVDVEYVVKEL